MSRLLTTKQSFGYAFGGLKTALRQEPNFQIHVAIGIAAVVLGFLLGLSILEWMLLTYAIFFVLILELFNTSLEALVDLVSPGIHPKAKIAKDVAAAAVLLASIQAIIVGVVVLGAHIFI